MINVFGSATGPEEVEALTASVRGGWMGMGAKVREFEARFAERLGRPFIMLDSGSNALYLAMTLLDLPPGSQVIVPALTWVSCAQAVVLAGHKPVFADVDLDTQNLDAACVERVLTRDTKAIMAVHYAGKPVRIETLRPFGLPILEDAAHAVDSTLNGKYCGAMCDVGIYSFDSVKNLATPEGGGLTAADPKRIERAKHLRYCGIGKSGFDSIGGTKARWWEYDIKEVFPKMLPNDVCASIGVVQLNKLEANQNRRRAIWARFQRELAAVSWLKLPIEPAADERHSYFTYFVRVLDGRRDKLAEYLLERQIYTTLRYHPLHMNPIYRSSRRLPSCELLNEQGLNLPLHPRLSDDDVSKVIDALKAF